MGVIVLQDNAPTHVTDLIYEALNENRINWVKKLEVSCKTLKIFNALVDSSISLIKLSKTVKFSNKCCVMW
jgi:hypothetical protein